MLNREELKREVGDTVWNKRSLLLVVHVLRWWNRVPVIGSFEKGICFIPCFEICHTSTDASLTAVSCSSPEAGAMTADTDTDGQHNHLMMMPM